MGDRKEVQSGSMNWGPGHVDALVINDVVHAVSLKRGRAPDGPPPDHPFFEDLAAYLEGAPITFRRHPVAWDGYGGFDRRVLEETRRIPRGHTMTYGEVATSIGAAGAQRAVGNALGRNRTCLVVPCHRVVAATGLGGFGGGLSWKKALLDLEKR